MADRRDLARRAARQAKMAVTVPLLLARWRSPARDVIGADVDRWVGIVEMDVAAGRELLYLLSRYREFRSLYYYRLRRGGVVGATLAAVASIVYRGEGTLHFACSDIGPGLFIQHGFATIIAAARIGANCWINQQVTIGFDRPESCPVLGDNVSVHAGAIVLGGVHIGDGARIGAGAVVLHDVPAGCTAVGVPARILPPKCERDD